MMQSSQKQQKDNRTATSTMDTILATITLLLLLVSTAFVGVNKDMILAHVVPIPTKRSYTGPSHEDDVLMNKISNYNHNPFRVSRQLTIPRYKPLTGNRVQRIKQVKLWMYQIQHLDKLQSIPKLINSVYQLVVIEPGIDRDYGPWPAKTWVSKLHKRRKGRLVLAYIGTLWSR